MEKNNLLSNVSSGAGGMAMGLIGSAAGGSISSNFNERAAERAYKRSKDYFDYVAAYNTPEQQKQRLKDAGLSVGLMYGQGGAGGTSTSGGQGQGTGNPGTNAVGMGLQAKQIELQQKNVESQIALNMATANKTEAEAKKIAGTRIS